MTISFEIERPRAYSYIRFSTPEQERGDSFRRQSEKAAQYALKHGLDLVDDGQFFDRGVSGYNGDNAATGALSAFRRAVEDGEVPSGSFLLIENLDRFSRQQAWRATAALAEIVKLGIRIVSLQDDREYSEATLDEDPHAMLLLTVGFMRAHDESRTKSLRVREAWGKKQGAATSEKKPMTKRLPAWLALSEDRTTIIPIPEKVEVIRRIFREALKGAGQHRIAHLLNQEGVPPFGDGERRAELWHRSYVKKVLENPAVIGTFTPHSTRRVGVKKVKDALAPIPGYFPTIISPNDFKRVNEARSDNPAPRMRAESGEVSNVLAGLAECPLCASRMTRVNKGRKGGTPYLVCTKAKGGAGCEYKQVKLDLVENAIRHAGPRSLVHDVPSGDTGLDEQIAAAQRNWDGVSTSIANIAEEIATGNKSPALRRRLAEYERMLGEIEDQREEWSRLASRGNKRAIARAVKGLETVFADGRATVTSVNKALHEAFARVVVDHRRGLLAFGWKHGGEPTLVPYDIADSE
jgi:DNA invertase Pin-like site-specific DNA recombinase